MVKVVSVTLSCCRSAPSCQSHSALLDIILSAAMFQYHQHFSYLPHESRETLHLTSHRQKHNCDKGKSDLSEVCPPCTAVHVISKPVIDKLQALIWYWHLVQSFVVKCYKSDKIVLFWLKLQWECVSIEKYRTHE